MKRIVFLLDGTWCDPAQGLTDSNIIRLESIIAQSLIDLSSPLSSVIQSTENTASASQLTRGFTTKDEVEHVVFYERGVGTGAFDRFRGGALGQGLEQNVRRAYRSLSGSYQPGDQVFVFGFSRGAFTARSLVGFIAASGLLKPECCTPELEELAWRFYRTAPGGRLPGVKAELVRHVHPIDQTTINCVGVFDTVGALGVPLHALWRANRERYEFHDVELSSIVKLNLHAIAIDEHRKPFEGAVWRRPKFKQLASHTEQVWFPGAHADIGGGYIPEERRQQQDLLALDDIPLDWMLRRILHFFSKFPCDGKFLQPPSHDCALAPQHEPRHGVYKLFRKAYRSIANQPIDSLGSVETEVGRDRHAWTIGEMVHVSALQRLGEKVHVGARETFYAPKNLLSVLNVIKATYAERQVSGANLRVVGWDGNALDPADARQRAIVQDLVRAARGRLERSRLRKSSRHRAISAPAPT
jgi:uncharacterized protein (DUF2235 family)